MQRSNEFFTAILVLTAIRILARSYFDTVLSVRQTEALLFVFAFGMILRCRTRMFLNITISHADAPVRKPELIPPDFAATEETRENRSSSPAYSRTTGEDSNEDACRMVRASRNIFYAPLPVALSNGRRP